MTKVSNRDLRDRNSSSDMAGGRRAETPIRVQIKIGNYGKNDERKKNVYILLYLEMLDSEVRSINVCS